MKGRASIIIEGIQLGDKEDKVTTKAIGEYRRLDNRYVLQYKEPGMDNDVGSDNTIEISPKMVKMSKSGDSSTSMVFDLTKVTHSVYDTPYGSLQFQINTTKIKVEDNREEFTLHMEYSLSHNGSHISDNRIRLAVKQL